MKIKSECPFEDFDCYKIFHNKMGRNQICLKHKVTGKRKTILYSKFLMSIKVGRILSSDEEVDHIDGNKLNDDISNLEIVTRSENRKRQSKLIGGITMVSLICPNCGIKFERQRNRTHIVKGGRKTCCSRSCSGQYQHYS